MSDDACSEGRCTLSLATTTVIDSVISNYTLLYSLYLAHGTIYRVAQKTHVLTEYTQHKCYFLVKITPNVSFKKKISLFIQVKVSSMYKKSRNQPNVVASAVSRP